ncbi:MAG: protein kinase [Polyangiaceae bacterium]|nr:protein kinase [Polyangiaceae bacterium]
MAETPGVICPQCRTVFPHASAPVRCPIDGGGLVDTRVFADSGEDAMLGRTIGGRFSVVARIGGGSMGTVYRARQEGMARDVALKILRQDRVYDAQAKARFEREARASSVLVSPTTVRVYDFGQEEDGSLFLAMELLDGESLGQRLRRVGKLPVLDAVRLARDVLASLAEAHEKGIIHRDVKPDNILLTRATGQGVEVAKVLDFGIAKVVRGEAGVDALETQAGTVFGTPRYMSPEQAQGKPLDARSDLYALAIILFQMIAGHPPFEDEDAVLVMAKHIKSAPPKLSEVARELSIPRALDAVVDETLAKDPQKRPSTAAELSARLEAAIAGWSPDVTARPQALPARKQAPISRGVIVAGAAAFGVAAFAGAYALVSAREVSPPAPAASRAVESSAAPRSASVSAATPPPSASPSLVPPESLPIDDHKKKPERPRHPAPAAPPAKTEPPKPEPPPAAPPPKPKYDRFD